MVTHASLALTVLHGSFQRHIRLVKRRQRFSLTWGRGPGWGERAFQFQVVFLHRLNTAYATAVSRIAAPFANTAFACATAFSAVNPYFCLR